MNYIDRDADLETLRREIASLREELHDVRRGVTNALETMYERVRASRAQKDGESGSDYAWFIERFRARVAQIVRADAVALVAAKGDERLLDVGSRRRAEHFPQALEGGYSGSGAYPADDVAAVAHLEALRQEGFDTLVFPAFASWWLDSYAGLRAHLEMHCAPISTDKICTVWDLRPRSGAAAPSTPIAQVLTVLRDTERRLGRPPDVLDWGTELELRAACTEYAVAFSDSRGTLPHFDRSLHVVVAPDADDVLAEARRVASSAVVSVNEDGVRNVEWLTSGDAPDVEIPSVEEAADGVPRMVRGPRGDALLVLVAEGVTPIGRWLDAAMRVFEGDPSTGAVGGRVVDFTGRLHHAGGIVLADGSAVNVGNADCHAGDPRYAFVRDVDFCSPLFMVTTRRAFEDAGGIDLSVLTGIYREADFGFRLRELGYSVYVQPESTAVCSRELTELLRSARRPDDERQQRRAFAARWKSMLRSRPAMLDTWGTAVHTGLPLVAPL